MIKFSSHKKGGHFFYKIRLKIFSNIEGKLGGDMWKNYHLVKKESKILQTYDIWENLVTSII